MQQAEFSDPKQVDERVNSDPKQVDERVKEILLVRERDTHQKKQEE